MPATHAAWRTCWLLLIACGCTSQSDPERAVIRYVELVREGRCEEAFRLLSSRYRGALEAEARVRDEDRARLADPPPPVEMLYCSAGPLDRVKLRRTRVASVGDSVADVRLVEAQPGGHLVPGFWPTRTDYVEMPMRAVREDGAWRAENPRTMEFLEALHRTRREERELTELVKRRNAEVMRRRNAEGRRRARGL